MRRDEEDTAGLGWLAVSEGRSPSASVRFFCVTLRILHMSTMRMSIISNYSTPNLLNATIIRNF